MTATPKWLKPVGIVALIWNLFGVAAFIMDLRLTPEAVARMSAAQQAMYAARPAWSVDATGVAVFAGALGCIGLIVGRRWAYPLLVLSLLGVILQDISLFGMSGAMSQIGSTAVILQCVVLVVALGLVLVASKGRSSGWLS